MTEQDAESLTIQCLQSAEAFEQLRPIWQTLERLDPQCTPFNTWTWNSLWWQYYATSRDTLALLVVREARRVVAIAPLYLHATRMCKVIPVRVLRFVGSGGDTSPDYLNLIAIPASRDAAEQAVLQYLPQVRGWQKLLLTDMAENSTLARRASGVATWLSGMALSPRYHVIQKAMLPVTFDEYRAQLSRKRRKQINHRQNRLDAAGQSALSICASSEELTEACDALVELHRLRWDSKHEAGGFRSVAYEQFHRAVIRQFFADDALWLATLKLDGKVIGVQYIFAWRGELLFVQSGYSPEHESLSPGHVLFTYVIQRGIEQGMTGLDMLKGHYAYKSAYARDETRTVDIGHLRPGVRALIGAVNERLLRRRSQAALCA